MKKIRRINLFAGPGSGKSTSAAYLFYQLKIMNSKSEAHMNVELIQEYVKQWAYERRKPQLFDQNYLFAKQQRKEEIPLRGEVDLVITDSPLMLCAAFSKHMGVPTWKPLTEMAHMHEEQYPSLNIFIDRDDRKYVNNGRFETLHQAKDLDKMIKSFLDENLKMPYSVFSCHDTEGMLNHIIDNVIKNNYD